jgi:hypothetical protein
MGYSRLDNLDVEAELQTMVLKEKQISDLRTEFNETVQKQRFLFLEYAKRCLPMFRYLQEAGYRFYNPNKLIDYTSTKGPVLALDRDDGKLYVYSIKNESLIEIDLRDQGKESIYNPHVFFEKFSFEDAMEGLLAAIDIQDTLIEQFKDEINSRIELANKYS